jgi:hypothetical protein
MSDTQETEDAELDEDLGEPTAPDFLRYICDDDALLTQNIHLRR